ncbi:MAG: uL15 family ribosomal protein [Clostridia bacterium]|nr:uL15 family ribosomal protein [Clostridia bacterium]
MKDGASRGFCDAGKEGIGLQTRFLLTAWAPEVGAVHMWVAIAILALVVIAELIGIGILTSKLLAARRRDREEEEEETSSYQYALVPVALTALPQITYTLLNVLLIVAAVLALVLTGMLIALYAMGLDFARARKEKKEEIEAEAAPVAVPAEETEYEAEEPALDAFEADEPAEAVAEEAEEEIAEEIAEEAAVAGEVIGAPADTITTVVRTSEAIPPENGQGPYKVVEKIVTETYKEVIKEVPAEASAAKGATADEVIAKLLDEYELVKKRTPEEIANAEAANADSIPTFARVEERLTSEDLDEDDDEDDDELDERAEGDSASDDDTDDEENDISDDRFTGNERIIGFDETTGCYIVAHYRKSFEAKLIQSRPNIKQYYSELKNALLSYKGTKSRVSWTADSFHNGRSPLAKINVKTRILEIYLALDPATLEGTVYRGKDVGGKKKYADTPFQYKVRTPRKFKWAMELVQRVCEEHGLTPIDIEHVAYDEQYPFDTTENLVERKLIKEYIRQEKPASTFELAEDHVPTVPEEDASVIPANANFLWELDNDKMNDEAHDPEPEIIPEVEIPALVEETPAEVPAEEPAKEPAAPVYKETVKVTEVRYTEHYYANGDVATVVETTKETEQPAQIEAPAEEAETEQKDQLFDEFDTEAGADKFGDADPFAEYRGEILPDESEEDEDEYEKIEVEVPAEEAVEEIEVVEDIEETEEPEEALAWTEIATEEAVEVEEAVEETVEELEDGEDVEIVYEYVYVDEDGNEIAYAEGELPEGYEEVVEEEVEYEEVEEYEETEEEVEEEPARPRAYEAPQNPEVALVDICTLAENFPSGATVNLEKLKSVGLAGDEARTLQIFGSGPINKALTVEADVFTIDAMRYIDEADGNVVVIRKQGGFGK